MESGKITIHGKRYNCSVDEKGNRIIDGKSVDEFLKTLSFDEKLDLAMLGKKVSQKDIKSGSPQITLHAIESQRNSQ